MAALGPVRAEREHAPHLGVEPRRFSRLRIRSFKLIENFCAALGGRRFYRRWFLRAGQFHVRTERLEIAELPAGLDGFRIAHLSDLHAGPFLGERDLRDVVARVNAERVDLVVITGDLITRDWREALTLLPDWRDLSARHGVLAVFGNHDYRDRAEGLIAEAYHEAGIRILRNEAQRIDTGCGVLGVVGVEDLVEGRRVDVEAARKSLESGDVELVLCHNPCGAPQLARAGCAAVLSGHSHGYQIDLPLIRRMGPGHPGERLGYGSTALIVSRGLGVVCVPFRFRAPLELVLVELHSAPKPGGGTERAA